MERTSRNRVEEVGILKGEIVVGLGLSLDPNMKILCGDTNIEHMKDEHPEDYEKHGDKMSEILADPDYVNINPNNGSIRYIKKYDDNVLVAVRVTAKRKLFARSLYTISDAKIEYYRKNGNFLDLKGT